MAAKPKSTLWNEKAVATALLGHSDENLAVLDAEYQRMREMASKRVSSTYTKGTLLVGAAGVLGGVTVTNAIGSRFGLLGLLGIVIYVVAAALGLLAMRPMRGQEVEPDDATIRGQGFTATKLKRSVILSHSKALAGYNATITHRNKVLVAGFTVLGAAWFVATGAALLGYFFPDPTAPLQVHLVK